MPKKTRSIKVTDKRGEKPWLRKATPSIYEVEVKEKQKTFLIVCEGQTEELYFKSFPVVTASIKTVPLGCSKSTLVKCAKEIVEKEEYDEVWCVFDMDFKPGVKGQHQDFNNAIRTAVSEGYKCAYSNDSFELWFVLHYKYLDQQQERAFYNDALSRFWNINYDRNGKNRSFARTIYDILLKDPKADQASAINNASRLYEEHKDKMFHKQNPVTTVFELVKVLNLHLRK